MLAWVLNMPLLFEEFQTFSFFKVVYIITLLKSVISLKCFTSFNSTKMLLNIIKPFDLLNTIPFTKAKTLVKGCVRYIFVRLFLILNESPCQARKNIFYFTTKALFALEKIKF